MNLTFNLQTSASIETKILALENLLYPSGELWQNEILDLHLQNKIPSSWLEDDFLLNFEQLQNFETTGLLHATHPWFDLSQNLFSLSQLPRLYSEHQTLESSYFDKEIKAKKIHEINQLLTFAKEYTTLEPNAHLVDLAGGKGHLSAAFQKTYPQLNLKRTVMDSNPVLCRQSQSDDTSQFQCVDILETQSLDIHKNEHLFILHGCGELSDKTIEQYLLHNSQSLHLVGCCYHMIKNAICFHTKTLQLSTQALHLATKTHRQFNLKTWQKRLNQKHYRYTLAIWFKQKFNQNIPALRSSPSSLYQADFLIYAKVQLDRLKIPVDTKILQELEFCYSDNFELIEKLIKLGALRLLFARPIEIYIGLRRAKTLSQNTHLKIHLGEIFDSKISPRNILIYAKN